MNMPSNAVAGSALESQAATPAVPRPTRPFYWALRRELWEYRSIYIAPLAVAGLALLGFLVASIGRALAIRDLAQRQAVLEEPKIFAVGVVMAVSVVVAVFYCLDTLHAERRDRSILFWKSLPVSDFLTVLSKATVPILVIPLLTFAITLAMEWIMLLLSSAVLAGSGLGVATLWSHSFQMSAMLLYHLVAIHGFWCAPLYAWLLLVSVWARRAPLLWALLPPLAIGVVEKIAFNTAHFAHLMAYRFGSGLEESSLRESVMAMDVTPGLALGHLLVNPHLWTGLALAALFLAATVRLRRYRGPV